MLRRHNRDMEKRVRQIREAVMERWEKLSDRDLETLSNTFSDLQEMVSKRYEQKRKQARLDLKPLMSAYEAKREVLDDVVSTATHQIGKQAGELTVQAGKTMQQKPWVAALAGAALSLLLIFTVGRRYLVEK
jgi:ElaB/YqjD/DUF883 family membrane-anchored ribosome-binding protein